MNNIFLLLKDHSLTPIKKSLQKEVIKYMDKIEYIMLPIENENNSYILHKVKKYMKEFTKAYISFTSVIARHSYIMEDGDIAYHILPPVDKEVYSIESMLQYLHSLNRMRYCNKLSNSNESHEFDLIEFVSFHLVIYHENDIIYESHLNDQFGPVDVLDRVKRVYNPIIKKGEFLLIQNCKWEFATNNEHNNTLIGLPLEYTKSYQFLTYDIVSIILDTIKDVYCASMIYNPEIDDDVETVNPDCVSEYLYNFGSLRFHDIWTHQINDYLEYVIYIPVTYMNLLTYAELIDLSCVKHLYMIKTSIRISLFNVKDKMDYEITSSSEDILTLEKFIQIIYNLNRGIL